MAQRIQDLNPVENLDSNDMFEIQSIKEGSKRATLGEISKVSVDDAVNQARDAISEHSNVVAGNDQLGHIQLENNAIPASLMPINFDATFQVFAGSFINFAIDSNLPNCVVPCLGGIIYPDQFVDELVSLKSKVPKSWILEDGSVQLPNLMDKVITFSPSNLGSGDYLTSTINGLRYSSQYLTVSGTEPVISPKNIDKYSIVTCIVTGPIKEVKSVKKYFLHKPVSDEYTGVELSLHVSASREEGVGFNSSIMKSVIIKRDQNSIARDYWSDENMGGDPIGILSDANQEPNIITTNFNIDKIPVEKRTFNMRGIPMYFDVRDNSVFVRRVDDPEHYISLFASFSYVGNQEWFNSGATFLCTSSTIRISSKLIKEQVSDGYYQFSNISGKRFLFYLSINGPQILFKFSVDWNSSRVTPPVGRWLYDFIFNNVQSDSTKRTLVLDWINKMPLFIDNVLDYYPNIPIYKKNSYDYIIDANKDVSTVFYSEMDNLKQIPFTQKSIMNDYFANDADKNDIYNIKANCDNGIFDIDQIMPVNGRKIYVDGYVLTLDVKPNYFQWETDEGYILRILNPANYDSRYLGVPSKGNGCNACFRLQCFSNSVIQLKFPGDAKVVETNTAHLFDVYFFVRNDSTAISGNGKIWRRVVFDDMIQKAPELQRDDAREFFNHFPLNWISNQNYNDPWSNSSFHNDFHWYMKNHGQNQELKISDDSEVEVTFRKRSRSKSK